MKYPSLWKLLVLFASPAFLTPAMAAPAKAQGTGSYTVKSGDTFAKIARTRGISLGTLLKSNHLSNSDHITPGQRIVIPGSKAPATKTTASAPAKKTPVKTAATKASPVKAKAPAASRKTAPVVTETKRRKPVDTTVNVTPPPQKGTCIVQSGDTLTRIQRRTGAPMSEILRLNKLTATSALRAGQTLKLPQEKAVVAKNTKPQPESVIVTRNPAPITDRRPSERPEPATDRSVTLETGTAQHKVVTGDTFSSIRRAYGVTETQLAKANPGVNAKSLKIGQSLTIPSQPIPIRPQAKPLMVRADGRILAQRHDPLMTAGGTDEGVSSDRTRTGYLVEEGDNIEKVARRFSTTEHEIRRLNRMGDADEISPGRYILVPFIRQAPEASAFARRDT